MKTMKKMRTKKKVMSKMIIKNREKELANIQLMHKKIMKKKRQAKDQGLTKKENKFKDLEEEVIDSRISSITCQQEETFKIQDKGTHEEGSKEVINKTRSINKQAILSLTLNHLIRQVQYPHSGLNMNISSHMEIVVCITLRVENKCQTRHLSN